MSKTCKFMTFFIIVQNNNNNKNNNKVILRTLEVNSRGQKKQEAYIEGQKKWKVLKEKLEENPTAVMKKMKEFKF
jgi:ribosomal silencing factor RsfS